MYDSSDIPCKPSSGDFGSQTWDVFAVPYKNASTRTQRYDPFWHHLNSKVQLKCNNKGKYATSLADFGNYKADHPKLKRKNWTAFLTHPLRECWLKELTYCIREQQTGKKYQQGNLKSKSTTFVNLSHRLFAWRGWGRNRVSTLLMQKWVIVERKRKIFSFPPSSERAWLEITA